MQEDLSVKFNDMPYSRPNVDDICAKLGALSERMKNAATFDEANDIFVEYEQLNTEVDTMFSLAYVRHSIDTEDKFYDAEAEFMDEASPVITEPAQAFKLALLSSPFRKQFEERYGDLMFKNIEISLKSFSPEIIPELQEENKLVTEYDKLIASAQIPYEGGVYTLSQLTPYMQVTDDEKRLAAWKANGSFFTENAQKLDEIYDKLTHLRDTMGKKLGYDGYTQLGYYRMNRNSYTAQDVCRFREAVKKYIVPVADRLYREQAVRIGAKYPMNHSDMALTFRSGNPVPKGTPEEILAHGKRFYHELSPETAGFIDFMYDNELLDVLSRKGKQGGGYCTSFPKYKAPFIFANFNGTQHDVEVITHEAGHAFAGYIARDVFPLENQSPTLESCEIHSMSMEFFAWPWAEGWFRDDTTKFYYNHLSGAITFIPYGTMVDHFQHIVYEKPDMTPAQRHEAWQALMKEYMPWVRCDSGIPFYGEGKNWQRQSHIYETPFYYIDYCLAQTVALQFCALMQKDRDDAWRRYMALVTNAGKKTFDGLVASAGLATPFGDTALKEVADAAVKWLDSVDMSKIK